MYALGFTRELPAMCAGQEGKAVPKLPEQTWLTDACSCSSVVDQFEPDDCRVLDPDRDHEPGLSFVLTVKATGTTTTYHAAMASNSHFVNGHVSDGGVPTASIKSDEQPYQFGCSPAPCINIASLGKACPSSFSRVSLVRITSEGCPELRVSTLFSESEPSYPDRCL